MEKAAVVLAAGHGTRMRSNKAKVLHEIWGKPMIAHVVETYLAAGIDRIIVVVGHQGAEVEKFLQDYAAVEVVWQREQLGTGHAVMQARQALADGSGRSWWVTEILPCIVPRHWQNSLSSMKPRCSLYLPVGYLSRSHGLWSDCSRRKGILPPSLRKRMPTRNRRRSARLIPESASTNGKPSLPVWRK